MSDSVFTYKPARDKLFPFQKRFSKRETTVRKWTFVRESESTVDTNKDISKTSGIETSTSNTTSSKSGLPAFLTELDLPSSSPEGSEVGSDLGNNIDIPSQSTSSRNSINVQSLHSRTKQKTVSENKNKKSSKSKASPDKEPIEDNEQISSIESQIVNDDDDDDHDDALHTTLTSDKNSYTGTVSSNNDLHESHISTNSLSNVSCTNQSEEDHREINSTVEPEIINKSQSSAFVKSPRKRELQKAQADSGKNKSYMITPTKLLSSPRKSLRLESRQLENGSSKKIETNSTNSEVIHCHSVKESVQEDLQNETQSPRKLNSNDRKEKVDLRKSPIRSKRINFYGTPEVKKRSLRLMPVNSNEQSDKNESDIEHLEQGISPIKHGKSSQKKTKHNDTEKQSISTEKNLNSSAKARVLSVSVSKSKKITQKGAIQESNEEDRLESSSPQSEDEDIDNELPDDLDNVNNQSVTSSRRKERNVNSSPKKSKLKCAEDQSQESKHKKHISIVKVPVQIINDKSKKSRELMQNKSNVNSVHDQGSLVIETSEKKGEQEALVEDEHIFSGSQESEMERSHEDIFYTSDDNFGKGKPNTAINQLNKRGKESNEFQPSPSKKLKTSSHTATSVTMETGQSKRGHYQNLEGHGQDKVIRREEIENVDEEQDNNEMNDVEDLGNDEDGDLEESDAMNHNNEDHVSNDNIHDIGPPRPESILVSSETPFRKVPAKNIKKRVRIFQEENDSALQDQTITMWRGQDRNRTSRDVIDLDIVLDSVSNIIVQQRSSCDNSVGKKALNSLLVYTRKEITDVINKIEDLKTHKKDLSVTKKDVKALRQSLIELQQEKKSLTKKIKATKDDRTDKLKEINYWLINMTQLLKTNKHQRSPKKVIHPEVEEDGSSIDVYWSKQITNADNIHRSDGGMAEAVLLFYMYNLIKQYIQDGLFCCYRFVDLEYVSRQLRSPKGIEQ